MGPPMGPAGGSQDIFVPIIDDDERIFGVRSRDENDAHDVTQSRTVSP